MADNLLDKASILLTPTAYNDGSMLSIKPENGDGDFDFSRSSAATRVNAQGLVENVQIISPELVSNGNFSQIGTEEVLNGNFSQEGSELVINGDFATDSDWSKVNATISDGKGNLDGDGQTSILWQDILTNGSSYKATFTVLDYNGLGDAKVINNDGISIFNITSNGTFTIYFQHSIASGNILFRAVSGAVFSIDNVSVKEVGQNWTLGTGWSIGDDKAICDGTQTGWSILQQNNILPPDGSIVKIVATVSDYSSGNLYLKAGFSDTGFEISSNGTFTTYRVVNGSSQFRVQADLNFIGSITNISVKEVGQDWTIENTWTIGDGVTNGNGANGATEEIISDITLPIASFKVSYEVKNYVSGSVNAAITGYGLLQNVSSDGVYTEYITTTSTSTIKFRGTNFNGSITNISVKKITDDTDLPRIDYSGFSYQDTLGSEEIVNGDFSVDSNWSKGPNWTISDGKANSDGSSNGQILQSNVFEANKTYQVTFTATKVSGSGLIARAFYGSYETILSITESGTYTTKFTPNASTNGTLYFISSGLFIGSIDNVSVKEVTGQEVVPDSGCGNWLLEGQSTNLVTYSEDFSTWTLGNQNVSIIPNDTISPSGLLNATKLTLGTANNGIYQSFTSLASQYTGTMYIKTATGTVDLKFGFFDGANVDADNITVTDTWTRFEVTKNLSASGLSRFWIYPETNGTKEVFIWGAQLENQSYATSYIPTNGATNTRLQDIANNSGNASLINSTEGVLYAEIAALTDSDANRAISLFEDNNNTISIFYLAAINTIRALILNNGSTQAQINFVLSDATDFNKIAFKYKENDCALWVNGIEVGTDVNATIPTALNSLNFDYVSNPFYGKTKALAVYKEALTDAELQFLTTI